MGSPLDADAGSGGGHQRHERRRVGHPQPSVAVTGRLSALGRPQHARHWRAILLLGVWGPGLVVMLADTDAGSLVTAAQSGAQWGYALLLPQILLVPVLYMVQEVVVRLGVVTGQGHGQLIREHFGRGWGAVSATALLASALGALLTELAGIAGVGALFGVSRWASVPVATTMLVGVAFVGSFRRVERIALAFGLAELAFIPLVVLAHPDAGQVVAGLRSLPLGHRSYLYLLAANVGAVVMPWMIFYQQSAIVAKGLTPDDIPSERRDTAVGAVVTQIVMAAVVVAFATTGSHAPLSSVSDLAHALGPRVGGHVAAALLGATVLGAALVAALVVSLAGSWGVAEVLGWRHSLDERPGRRNARFFGLYALAHVAGAVVVLSSADLVGLAVDVEVLNALILPVVLALLLALESRALPPEHRMRGPYRVLCTATCVAVMVFGLLMFPVVLHAR